MKQLYTTLVLLILACGIGGWIYFNERGPAATEGATVLLRTEPAKIQNIELRHTGARSITLIRRDENWQVRREGVDSVDVPAAPEAVDKLLNALRLVQSSAVVKGDALRDAGQYGLGTPASTLIVDGAKLEFGSRPPFDNTGIYVRATTSYTRDGATASVIGLVPASLAGFVEVSFKDWRDKRLLRFSAPDISACEVNTPALKASFVRARKGANADELDRWDIVAPMKIRADSAAVVTYLQQLSTEKTAKYLEDNPKDLARWGLDKPVAVIKLTTPTEIRTLRIGKKVGEGYAAQNSLAQSVFLAPASVLKDAQRPLRVWRDKAVLRFWAADLKMLSAATRGRKVEFINDSTDDTAHWKRTDDGGNDKKSGQAVQDFGLALKNLNAADFIDKPATPATYGFDKPEVEFQLRCVDWPQAKAIQLATKNGVSYARVGENGRWAGPVYKLAPKALDVFRGTLNILFPVRADNKAP